MGIKGIYGEIGPGERISFSKLAVEKLEKTGQPFRVAIDVSIWQFQTQAGQGGSNPAIRTFYYRLLRLLSISVQPVFIFDGPHKPPFKRGKKSGHHGASVPNMLTKQMLKLFGFPFYQAPGEAEAECALLQREGIVDAVLSEDVDTLMFGCGQTLRNWSSEGSRGNKAPTHVSVYNAKATKEGSSGLDREGMVLIALMSGGDYITEGIPGCGIKVACQAARAGYGKSLCQLSRTDVSGLEAWRENLNHEMQTNESKYFRTKHKTLRIPDTFPDKEVLGYYTHPVVSSASKIQKLKDEIVWDGEVDIQGLRLFVADAFEWTNRIGAVKFIRGLAPVLLVHKLLLRMNRRDSGYGDIVLTAMNEMELVRAIGGSRNHFSTDGLRELRLVYMPIDIVGLDLDAEYDDSGDYGRDGLAPVGNDDQIEGYISDDAAGRAGSPTRRGPSQYDPTQPDKVWVPATVAKIGVPLKVEDYEESLKDPKKFNKAKSAAKRAAAKKPVMPQGALDRFVTVSKPGVGVKTSSKRSSESISDGEDSLPPTFLAPILDSQKISQQLPRPRASRSIRSSAHPSTDASLPQSKLATTSKARPRTRTSNHCRPATSTNPWSLASTAQTAHPVTRITKSTAAPSLKATDPKPIVYSLLSSSPVAPSPQPVMRTSTPEYQQSSPPPISPPQLSNGPTHQRESLESLEAHHELDLPGTVTISRHRSGRSRQHLQSQNQSRAHTPTRGVTGKDFTSSASMDDRDSDGLSNGLMDFNPEDVIRRIDFAIETNPSPALQPSSPSTSPSDAPPSPEVSNPPQYLDHELEGEEPTLPTKQRNPPPPPPAQHEHPPTPQIIDLSSSPPISRTQPPARPQASHPPPPRGRENNTLASFFNTAKPVSGPSSSSSKNVEGTTKSQEKTTTTTKKKKKKKKGGYIVLRESLVGAWKEIDEDEDEDENEDEDEGGGKARGGERDGDQASASVMPGAGAGVARRRRAREGREGIWRRSQIEVLDLTEN